MSRAAGATTAGLRLLLALVVGGALAQLLPPVLAASVDSPSVVVLALACAVAAVVLLSSHRAASVPVPSLALSARADGATPFLAGRVTDPQHHPLRPRAPGRA